MEEVQKFINLDLRKQNSCRKGQVPYLTEVTTHFSTIGEYLEIQNECFPDNYQQPVIGPCICMGADLLNCFYCVTTEHINGDFTLVPGISDDHVLISADIVVQWVGDMYNPILYHEVILTFAKVECRDRITYENDEPAIYIEICC